MKRMMSVWAFFFAPAAEKSSEQMRAIIGEASMRGLRRIHRFTNEQNDEKMPKGGKKNEQSGTALPCLLSCGRIGKVIILMILLPLLSFVNDKIFQFIYNYKYMSK